MIYTFGRAEIEAGINLTEPYALISISSPRLYGYEGTPRVQKFTEAGRDEAMLPADENRLGVLRLAFHDLDHISNFDDNLASQIRMYNTEDARRVAAYVKAWKVNLVVHCDAGISRSQGMANAISDHLDVEVKHSRHGMPNRLVYRLTWEALNPKVTLRHASDDDVVLSTRRDGKTSEGADRYRVVFKNGGKEPSNPCVEFKRKP